MRHHPAVFLLFVGACAAVEDASRPAGVEDPEAVVLERAMGAAEGGFVAATAEPFPSLAVSDALITEWVSEGAWPAFAAVDPSMTGSGMELPEDSLIVRTVLDAAGEVSKHTVLWFPPGVEDVDGLYFLVADADWAVMEVEGARQAGTLSSCQGCHASRGDDGWVFGVPR